MDCASTSLEKDEQQRHSIGAHRAHYYFCLDWLISINPNIMPQASFLRLSQAEYNLAILNVLFTLKLAKSSVSMKTAGGKKLPSPHCDSHASKTHSVYRIMQADK